MACFIVGNAGKVNGKGYVYNVDNVRGADDAYWANNGDYVDCADGKEYKDINSRFTFVGQLLGLLDRGNANIPQG